ncbi:hypothetical protein Tco_0549080 [Tanacetum coccineum]
MQNTPVNTKDDKEFTVMKILAILLGSKGESQFRPLCGDQAATELPKDWWLVRWFQAGGCPKVEHEGVVWMIAVVWVDDGDECGGVVIRVDGDGVETMVVLGRDEDTRWRSWW